MVCDACPTISSAIWKTIVVIGVTNAIAVSCFLYVVIFFFLKCCSSLLFEWETGHHLSPAGVGGAL